MEYIPEYMEEQDKEKYNSLKQLSDLSFPAEWHPSARAMQRYALYNVKTSIKLFFSYVDDNFNYVL